MKLKDCDMLKLEKAFFRNLQRNNAEYGQIGLDCKRPFGNSNVEQDILEIIGAKMSGDDGDGPCWSSHQIEYASAMYDGLIAWLWKRHA